LKRKLTPITGKVVTDWLKINKQAITEEAEESIGLKKIEKLEMAPHVE
jgi:hypothetical protein